jgi:nucleotide-binding universal stress UspA family protein
MKRTHIRNILVPVDFSEMSGPAIETAQRLAKRFGAAVHLVHVHEYYYPIGFIAPGAAVPMSMRAFREVTAEQIADRFRALARKHGIPTTNCYVRNDIPVFNGVCKVARQIDADLIVTPTHGYIGVRHFFEGGHAERIVQHSPCPVLVARNREEKPSRIASNGKASGSIDTILVPVDFSQSSFEALEYAIEFAERVAAELIVFHAVHLGYAFTADGYGVCDFSILIEGARKAAEHQMQEFVRLAKFRGTKFETVVKDGPAVSEICAFAEQRNVDVIITATHGRTGFKHLLMGSVAEQIVRHAHRLVLVVPSHPEVRAARLARGTRRDQQPISQFLKNRALPASIGRLTKRNQKLVEHPFPERRKTNKFRESHSRQRI